MRVVFLFLLICLCAAVVIGNHDNDAKKRHNGNHNDKRHHQVKHGVHKKNQGHQRSHGDHGHDHDKRHHQMKHGIHKKNEGHQRTHGHKERHGHNVAKKSHADHLDHNNKRQHKLHHEDHAKRLGMLHKRIDSGNETTTETLASIGSLILGNSTLLPVDSQSTSPASDISSTTDDGEEDSDNDDVGGGDDDETDTTPKASTTPKPPHAILLPIPQFFWPPLLPIPHWIQDLTKDITDRFNCVRRLTVNITATIRANLRRNPQEARNISLIVNDRVVYEVSVQLGVTCPSLDEDQDSALSLGFISQALHQSSCVNSIARNITCEIIRGITSNLTTPQHIILKIDSQVVYDITLDLSQRLCTKPGSQQRAALLHYLIGFPANIHSAYPIKRSGLNNVAKRVYDRLYDTNKKSE